VWQNVQFLNVKTIKKHCAFYGTRRGVTVFARVVPSSSPELKNQSNLTHLVLHFVTHSFVGILYETKRNLYGDHVRPWHGISVWAICGIFMKFGMAVAYKILPRTGEYPENRRSDSHNFLGRQWISTRTGPHLLPDFRENLCRRLPLPLSNYEFRENGGSQTAILYWRA
jgi:hypothetical protein